MRLVWKGHVNLIANQRQTIIRDPDLNTEEELPAAWQEYLQNLGCPEPEVWPCWRRFKNLTRYPFERKRWLKWCDAWMTRAKAAQWRG
jgi:hypothetical protein